jgi:hypothetical protein
MMKRDLALWTGVLTGPVVWSVFFLAKFFIAYWICAFHWKPAAWVLSIVPLVPTAAAGMLAWSQYRELGAELPDQTGGEIGRSRALALAGIVLSAGFLVVLIAQTFPELILTGCE